MISREDNISWPLEQIKKLTFSFVMMKGLLNCQLLPELRCQNNIYFFDFFNNHVSTSPFQHGITVPLQASLLLFVSREFADGNSYFYIP